MFEIIKVNGKYVMDEVDQSRGLQVPSFVNDPARNAKRLRRLMEEEEQRAAKEVQPMVNAINMTCWSVACVVFGMILGMMRL